MTKLLIIIILYSLSGCKNETIITQLDHIQKDKMQLAVDDIQIIENYNSSFTYPDIDYLLDNTPDLIYKKWLMRNFVAQGKEYVFQIILNDASLKEKFIENKYLYTLNIEIDLKLLHYNDSARPNAKSSVKIKLEEKSDKLINPKNNQLFFEKMLNESLELLKRELEDNIKTHFPNLIM